jgi:hypothetical protein
MLSVRIQAIDGKRTFTFLDLRPYRLLQGPLLIFPSYYRRKRPELAGHPAVVVSYRFNGFLDDIYATLVVRLHPTTSFGEGRLWRYAADFRTLTASSLE